MEAGQTLETGYEHISCLFPEILAIIFSYLELKEKGRAARVCKLWKDAAYHRSVWRNVEAKLHLRKYNPSLFSSLVKRGIKRIQVLSLKRGLKDVMNGIKDIESLSLSGCYNVTDVSLAHAFSNDVPLKELNLSLCKQITDSSLGRIAQTLKNLHTLKLGGCCAITDTGLLLVAWGLKNLKNLDLRSCWCVGDQGIGYLAGLHQSQAEGTLHLENLDLQDCQNLTDQALKNISIGLHGLKSVNLSFCGKLTDSGLRFIAKMPSLSSINLRSDNVSDVGIGYLAEGNSKVVHLDISFCERIGDQALIYMAQGLGHLRSVSLNACNITDDGIKNLVTCLRDLYTLNIGQCGQISDKSLILIAEHLKGLKCIDLYGCTKITTVGLEQIMQIATLTTLNLGLWHKK